MGQIWQCFRASPNFPIQSTDTTMPTIHSTDNPQSISNPGSKMYAFNYCDGELGNSSAAIWPLDMNSHSEFLPLDPPWETYKFSAFAADSPHAHRFLPHPNTNSTKFSIYSTIIYVLPLLTGVILRTSATDPYAVAESWPPPSAYWASFGLVRSTPSYNPNILTLGPNGPDPFWV